MNTYTIITISFFLILLQGCGAKLNLVTSSSYTNRQVCTKPYKIGKTWYQPVLRKKGFKQYGIASWYGKKFHGKKTSSGEIYNMYSMTAAHKTFPIDCWIRVKSLTTNKSVDVKINDRGPFIKNRIVDLSFAAAKKIGIIKLGISPVEVTVLGDRKKTKDGYKYIRMQYHSTPLIIQIGTFNKKKTAEKLKEKIKIDDKNKKIIITKIKHKGKTLYRVTIHNFKTFENAYKYKTFLKTQKINDAIIITNY